MKSLIRIDVKTSGIDDTKAMIVRLYSPAIRKAAIAKGAVAANDEVKSYYRIKGRPLWENKSLPTHGSGRVNTNWFKRVQNAWIVKSVTTNAATLSNDVTGFSHKITGGVIRAKRKGALTIPLVPEAHGLTAKTYSKTINRLFRVKGVLAEAFDNAQGFRAVFALKKSVNQKPVPNALPPEASYVNAFLTTTVEEILRIAETDS